MAECAECRSELAEGARRCPACGQAVTSGRGEALVMVWVLVFCVAPVLVVVIAAAFGAGR